MVSEKTAILERLQNFWGCFSSFKVMPSEQARIYNLSGSSVALFLSLQNEPFIAVQQTSDAAIRLYEDIQFFRSVMRIDHPSVFFLPEADAPESSGRRAEVIYNLRNGDSIVTSINGMNAPLWSSDDLKGHSIMLLTGQEIDRESVEHRLTDLGYKRVSLVMERGQYSSKGWLLDIFPSTGDNPVRVEFFGDEIEQIKLFDIESQRSIDKVQGLLILPAREPLTGHKLTSLVSAGLFSVDFPLEGAILLSRFDFKGAGFDAGLLSMRGHGIYPDERGSLDDVGRAIKGLSRDNTVIVVSSSMGQAERVRDILFDGGVIAPIIETDAVLDYQGDVVITEGRLSKGLFIPGLLILTEREIFGERPVNRPLRRSRVSGLLNSIDEIAPGDLVVHVDHGIGRFVNIERRRIGDFETDLIALEYSGGDRLYIPLYNIDRIKKYRAEEGASPQLDRLGGKTWQRRKERVRQAVKEMAEKLLRLYAEREVVKGFAYSEDTEIHREFYGFFPYEETPDQIRAIEEIIGDMESERPMDRLLCGDVGYGKTEVAMRAAFKAVYDGRQVAVLVPTTILCEQHYQTFKGRFSAFPVRIDYLSRFKSRRQQAATLKALAEGEIDIIIGTHSLLRRDVSFCNLGLLIIDEEHRFGVGQKERIKELKKGVDVLSMTATPIPRTLQMAVSGIRGMSLIETPPEERLAVKSTVSVFDHGLIREAIERELERGGQVLFVHNSVSDIEGMAKLVERLVPGVRIAIAHGQMPDRLLEDVMLGFISGEVKILVCTTIIGSGIDIPTANTIIINRADKIGLADLYQLRGRVGRSNVRAYAYFLIPPEEVIGLEAKKRLQAIREMSFLGAGFRLAMKDLEIRGAGNLLGPEQSGHIHAVGFDMYVEMLGRAVAELRGVEIKEEVEPSINLRVRAFIPDTYIEDLTLRLSLYRRIANAKSIRHLEDLRAEMEDRFGDLPDEVNKLLDIMRLKIMAKGLLITSISEGDGRVRFTFSDKTPVKTERILGLHETFHGIRFKKDGFELNLRGSSKSGDVISMVYDVMNVGLA